MNELKPNVAIKYLEKMGITTLTEEDNNLTLALGGLQKGLALRNGFCLCNNCK